MTEDDAKAAAATAEPSMEDILASIRRILAEDGAAPAAGATPGNAPTPRPRRDVGVADKRRDARPTATLDPFASKPSPAIAPRSVSFADGVFGSSFGRSDEEDVFVLTPAMRIEVAAGSIGGERVVSDQTSANGTDVLAQLASAILDRRDIAVTAREVTLEGMVREMLRPLLREWLDRNLPYLIERLVKREIDQMINRAERLED